MKRNTLLLLFVLATVISAPACHDETPGDTADATDATDDTEVSDDTGDADTEDAADAGETPTVELLRDWARNPPTDALEPLGVWIGDDNLDPYVRERAIFTAVEIATRRGVPEDVAALLEPVATDIESPASVRSAAWANLRLVEMRFPQAPSLELSIAIDGEARVGATLTIASTTSAPADAEEGRLNVEVIDEHGQLAMHRLFDVETGATLAPFEVEFAPVEIGVYYVSVDLRVDHSATRDERITRRGRITVGEDSGTVLVFDD